MIKFKTPTGERTAIDEITALNICRTQADVEASTSTGIYQQLSTTREIKIICNNKTWIIERKPI